MKMSEGGPVEVSHVAACRRSRDLRHSGACSAPCRAGEWRSWERRRVTLKHPDMSVWIPDFCRPTSHLLLNRERCETRSGGLRPVA